MECLEPGIEEEQGGANPEMPSKAMCSWEDLNTKDGSWAWLFSLVET